MSESPRASAISESQLRAIERKHGLEGHLVRLRSIGYVNRVWATEAVVVRIARQGPAEWEMWNERAAIPAACASGVRAPRLIAFDGDRDIVETPFVICERVGGRPLSFVPHTSTASIADLYRDLGEQLATLHSGVTDCDGLWSAPETCGGRGPTSEALAGVEGLLERGDLSTAIAAWILERLDRLAPAVEAATGIRRFVHHDLSPDNVLADGGQVTAIIDWGEATWADPAFDLAHLPARAVPFVVEGYRRVTPFDLDDSAEARIVWDQLDISRWRVLDRAAHEWRRTRVSRALELLAAMAEWPDRWRALVA